MVETQLRRRGLPDPRLLNAFESVPRHLFVPEEDWSLAYGDSPLPIGFGQTISQPYIVALMTNLLRLRGGERVLEVGTGSGYQAAILSYMAKEVYTIEYVPELAARAQEALRGYPNVHCRAGDGSMGWPDAAPFDGIIVAAASPKAPDPLLNQLKDGGRLAIPIGRTHQQFLELWTRHDDKFERETELSVTFVLLRGKHGWK